jgi:hypothetical protein
MYELKIIRERKQGYGSLRRVRDAAQVYDAFREDFSQLDREMFLTLLLDGKNQVLGFNVVSVGSLTAALVHPREVFTPALLGNAAAVILVHNHPSGDCAAGAFCAVSGTRTAPPGITFLEGASRQLFGMGIGRANDDARLTTHAEILRCFDLAISLAEAAEHRDARRTGA